MLITFLATTFHGVVGEILETSSGRLDGAEDIGPLEIDLDGIRPQEPAQAVEQKRVQVARLYRSAITMITIRREKIELNARKGSEKLIEIVIIERKKKILKNDGGGDNRSIDDNCV